MTTNNNNNNTNNTNTINKNITINPHIQLSSEMQKHLRQPQQQGIRVIHRKKEETYPTLDNDQTLDAYFIFEWQVRVSPPLHLSPQKNQL
jgi:hypothetical protein